jgi:hypothetical protein
MLRKLATTCLMLIMMLAAALSIGPVQAQPPSMPHQFWGTVTIGANPAPAGTSIVAQINGVNYASTTVDSSGRYGYSPSFIIPADNPATPTKDGGTSGDTVSFFVGGTAAQTFVFANGGMTKLGLSISSGGGGGTPPSTPSLSTPANGATAASVTPNLQWNASSGATSYQAQVSTASGFSSIIFDQSGISTTNVTASPALNSNTTYYWRVNASNSSGTSGWSTVRSFTTAAAPTTPPSAPTLSAPVNNATGISTTVTLQWEPATGATSYQAQVSTASSFSTTVSNQSNILYTQVTVLSLNTNTTYYWRVNASNSAGTSDWSAFSSFTTASAGSSSGGGGGGMGESGGSSGGQSGTESSETIVSASVLGQAGTFSLNSAGLVSSQTTLKSTDGTVQLNIKANTAISLGGQSITVAAEATPPATPTNAMLISAYNLTPNGATFDPAITLTLKYNALTLPRGVTESNLYIAYWTGSNWAPVVSDVDTQSRVVTAEVSHFTVFALLGETTQTAAPAASFNVSNLNINPATVQPGGPVNVSASVTNLGSAEGSYRAVLTVNGINEAEKVINLAPQASQTVTFSVTKNTVGQYQISIGNQKGNLTVSEAGAAAGKSPVSSIVIIALAIGVLIVIILIIAIVRKQRA